MAQPGPHGHHPPQQAVVREVAVEGTNAAARCVAQGQDTQRRGCWAGTPSPVSCSSVRLQRYRGVQGMRDTAETWGSAVGGVGHTPAQSRDGIADRPCPCPCHVLVLGSGHVPSPGLSLLIFKGGAHTLWGWCEASERGACLTSAGPDDGNGTPLALGGPGFPMAGSGLV